MKHGRYAEMPTRRSRRHEDHEEDSHLYLSLRAPRVLRRSSSSSYLPGMEGIMSADRLQIKPLSRRQLLQALAAAGITGPAAIDLVAQARSSISSENLRQASAILGETFTADRLTVIQAALQRNLEQFQIVRDLVIDDSVEPAPVFDPRRR